MIDTQNKATPQEIEVNFRSSLEDVLTVIEKMETYCGTIPELIGVLRLGLENDAQLRLLLGKVRTR